MNDLYADEIYLSRQVNFFSNKQIIKKGTKTMNERILFIKLDPETDGDIIRWMKSLPPRTVNKTVNDIVVAEIRGQIARIPYKISYTKTAEPLRCRLIFRS